MKYVTRGFTLIELLVVISIIALLASVILASLSSAKSKAVDTKIKSQLHGMRAQSGLYVGTGSAFSLATCATSAGSLFETANSGLGNQFSGLTLANTACVSAAGQPLNGVNWAVAATLSSGFWCVDNNGTGRSKTAAGVDYSGLTGASGNVAILTGATTCQ